MDKRRLKMSDNHISVCGTCSTYQASCRVNSSLFKAESVQFNTYVCVMEDQLKSSFTDTNQQAKSNSGKKSKLYQMMEMENKPSEEPGSAGQPVLLWAKGKEAELQSSCS